MEIGWNPGYSSSIFLSLPPWALLENPVEEKWRLSAEHTLMDDPDHRMRREKEPQAEQCMMATFSPFYFLSLAAENILTKLCV